MIIILLLVLIGLVAAFSFIAAKKFWMSPKHKVRKELVKELRRSGKLRKESDALHLKLELKSRELRASKDRSIELMRQFVGLTLVKQTHSETNAKCSKD